MSLKTDKLELQRANPDMYDYIKKVLNIENQLHYEEAKIKIKYADNEYGRAASLLPVPAHAYPGDAGIDLPIVLSQAEIKEGGKKIHPTERELLHTGLILEFPIGYWARIIHRSSTERKFRLRVIEGVIDDYRNEILIQVHNGNTYPIDIEHGQRLAQLILAKTASFSCEVLKDCEELRPSVRATKGFGSSGV